MTARIDIRKYLASTPGKALLSLGKLDEISSSVETSLLELVKVRTSQINGCAHCIDMHTKDARAMGETEQRLYGLSAWREAPYYSDRERAALEWTEALARLADTHVPDEVYERVRGHLDEGEFMAVTFAALATNAWNRLVLSCHVVAGSYKPQAVHA